MYMNLPTLGQPVYRSTSLWIIWATVLAIFPGTLVRAQAVRKHSGFDTVYVRDYSRRITARVFSSTKYNAFVIASPTSPDLVYRPNNRINVGVGASYRALTLNIGFALAIFNNDNEVRGRTRFLDAQANIYNQRWATNLFLQVFGGYYISSHDLAQVGWTQDTQRPYRADLVQFNFGASSLRILNDRRFSYRASFNQDAWQRKSQGSFLLGGYMTYYNVRADSSLVPTHLIGQFDAEARLRRGSFLDLGPMAGYAYTFVHREHWFLTVSAALGGGLSIQRVTRQAFEGESTLSGMGLGWHGQVRSGIGYNSAWNCVGLSFSQENIGYLVTDRGNFRWNVGNVRLNFAHRFNRRIQAADRGLRWFRKQVMEPIKTLP